MQTISGGTNWKQVSLNTYFSGAIKTDGTLWMWGLNTTGQLGNNTRDSKSSPIQTISGGTNWKQIATGSSGSAGGYTAAIKTDGTLWLWGQNTYGQLGDNTRVPKSSPIQTISGGTNWKQVSGGSQNLPIVAAIKTDGTLWTWGRNYYGALGNNTRDSKSSPIQTIAGGTNWKQVSCGYSSIAAITDIF